MAPNRFMTDLDFTKTQIAVYWVVILLSVDSLNPIQILCKALPFLEPWHAAVLSTLLLIYVILSEFKQVLFFCVKVFFHSILSIFFSQVEVVGVDNIPRFGPVIFTINHANQFIDAVAVLCTCQHKISYLMAEASWKRRIIGDIAWAMDVVPVKRAQDEAKRGAGKITMAKLLEEVKEEEEEGQEEKQKEQQPETTTATTTENATTPKQDRILVQGYDTKFLKELVPKDKIRPPGTPFAFKVIKVISHDQVIVDGAGRPETTKLPQDLENPVAFDVLKHVDTAIVFEKVIDRLASGGAVGIFPEGGSHDRTQLLPLKVGVSLIAYTALEKDNLLIPIVPVGLNYFRAHRWRGRAVIEYGRPTVIDPSTLPKFKAGGAEKRQVCNGLLEDIERSMKSVIVSAPDYDTLQLLHTARRLWQRKKGILDVKEKQDLTRRFAQGYQLLLQHPNPPEEWIRMQERIQNYRNQLKDLGIRDYQVPALTEQHMEQELFSIGSEDAEDSGSNGNGNTYPTMDDPEVRAQRANQVLDLLHYSYQVLHLLFLILVAAIPFLLINFPVGILAGIYAEQRRKRALAKSKVKVKGYDVMLTERVVFCIVAVPTLWIFYFVMLTMFTDWERPVIFLCIGCLPLFAYMGIVAAEAGMVDWKDLWPLLMRLNPSARKQLAKLPATRKALQDDLRAFIKTVGPKYLGGIYNEKDIDWQMLWEKEKEQTLNFGSRDEEEEGQDEEGDDKKDQ